MNNWQGVFDAYPKVEQIYVVAGMPFINKRHADAHALAKKKPVETVKRPDAKGKKADATDEGLESAETNESPKIGKKGGKKA